jgi:hypothetical protein
LQVGHPGGYNAATVLRHTWQLRYESYEDLDDEFQPVMQAVIEADWPPESAFFNIVVELYMDDYRVYQELRSFLGLLLLPYGFI